MLTEPPEIPTVDLFGVRYAVTDYEVATARIMHAARARESFGVSALAVHGLMEADRLEGFRECVNSLDLVVPDGQPVRWTMNWLHGCGLEDRVYGPTLAWHVTTAAAEEGIPVFLFGSTEETCVAFAAEIRRRCAGVEVHHQSDRFRDATPDEDAADVRRINDSGAGVVLVGRGCPRQERWVSEHLGKVNAAMLAVGAAFDYGAGNVSEPPEWIQRAGLQWMYRLRQDPRRLWRRYAVTNARFSTRVARALLAGARKQPPSPSSATAASDYSP